MTKLADAIHFDYIEELCEEILDRFDGDEDIQISVIGKYEETKAFIKEFMKYDDINFDCIELHAPECNGYDKEYIVDITNTDGDISFYCVPCNEDGKYFRFDGDVLYLLDGVKQSVLDTCEYDEKYFVIIGEDECDCDEECDCCKGEPYVLNVKLNLDTDEAEKIIRKYRNDFYKEIAIFKELLDF